MDDGFLYEVALVGVLILVNGFFAGSEIAVISSRRSRIQARARAGDRRAEALLRLKADPDRFLATVQIGVTVVGTLASAVSGVAAVERLEPLLQSLPWEWARNLAEPMAVALVVCVVAYLSLVVGELVPKSLAVRHADMLALVVARPIERLSRVTHFAVAALTASTRAVLRVFGQREQAQSAFHTIEDLRAMLQEAEQQGVVDSKILRRAFSASEMSIKQVMVPRPQIFALDADTPPEEAGRRIVDSGFSRIPVCEGSLDNVIGLVYIKDVVRVLERHQPVVVRKILQPVQFVPETKKVDELLDELQARRSHLVLVVDEHGTLVGLVTLEDLLEQIVGEIRDEYDWEERPVEQLRDGSLVVEGTVPVADLRERHRIPIPDSAEFDTVAGFVLDQLGTLPKGGEVVPFGEYELVVAGVERNRISKVRIRRVFRQAGEAH